MSVWESIEALWDFVYSGGHLEVMRRRREWMTRLAAVYMCLWWVAAGHIPTIEEARERLEHLERHGPTPHAFTFKQRYASGRSAQAAPLGDLARPRRRGRSCAPAGPAATDSKPSS